MNGQCPWRRAQIRSAHGETSNYGRRCMWKAGHLGPHEVPRRAKQANDGVWVNPDTGQTITQHADEVAF